MVNGIVEIELVDRGIRHNEEYAKYQGRFSVDYKNFADFIYIYAMRPHDFIVLLESKRGAKLTETDLLSVGNYSLSVKGENGNYAQSKDKSLDALIHQASVLLDAQIIQGGDKKGTFDLAKM